jgi:IS605 OrfB family transposase
MGNVYTRKIQLLVDEESTLSLKEVRNYFSELNQKVCRASNLMVTHMWEIYNRASKLPHEQQEKLGLINQKTGKPYFGATLFKKYAPHEGLKNGYDFGKIYFNEEGLSYILTSFSKVIYDKFCNEINDTAGGKKSIPTFKSDAPINFSFAGRIANKLTLTTFRFSSEILFKLYYGKDKSNNHLIVERILAEKGSKSPSYKLCNSKIQFKDGKFYLYLVFKIPTVQYQLDPKLFVGVDLGMCVSAAMTLSEGYAREFISMQGQINALKNGIQRRRRQLQKELKHLDGGKGRKRKLKALERFQEQEKNAVRNINHIISKGVVNFTITNGAGTIKMENLKGIDLKTKFLKQWTYYQLQQMIEYKAERAGIKVQYINPMYTSQTCSKCGNLEKGQRPTQSEFECKSCDHKENADLNAARNIARSTNYSEKKNEVVIKEEVLEAA